MEKEELDFEIGALYLVESQIYWPTYYPYETLERGEYFIPLETLKKVSYTIKATYDLYAARIATRNKIAIFACNETTYAGSFFRSARKIK